MKAQIDRNKDYSLYELYRMNAFYWIKAYNSYLKTALKNQEKLGLQIFGEGKGTSYRIDGKKLIKFLNEKHAEEAKREGGKTAEEAD